MAEKPNTTAGKEQRGETFLLRLTPDLRKDLYAFRVEFKAKSLQTLILQFIVEGMSKDDFTPTQLFSKDLHARQLGLAIGSGTEIESGHTRASGDRKGPQTSSWNTQALVGTHERVLDDLESQKLTSFAALMDPALMSYRLLLDFCVQEPIRQNPRTLMQDFSTELCFAAERAMERKKWNFAQILLRQACDIDKQDVDIAEKAGVYLIKRLMMRGWLRTKDSEGVTNGTLVTELPYSGERTRVNVEDTDAVTDDTEWAMATDAYELLSRGWHVMAGHQPVHGRLSCWRDLAFIIRWAASPEGTTADESNNDKLDGQDEESLLLRIKESFRVWQGTFRMTREQSALQREWSGWLDALEIFWWLGYRKEAFELATEVRNFSSDKDGTSHFSRVASWDPANEWNNVWPEYSILTNMVVPYGYEGIPEADSDLHLPYPYRANLV
jgi:hypothetical protein